MHPPLSTLPAARGSIGVLGAAGIAALLTACQGNRVSSGPDADAGPSDAAGEAQVEDASGGFDANSSTEDSPFVQCLPGNVSGFHATWHPPAAPQDSCMEAELDDLVADCFETISTMATCDAFQKASPACWSCMVTSDSNATWGPIIVSSITHLYYGNYAGCLALETGDDSPTSCGAKQQAARVCSEFACSGPDCPAFSQPELAAISACTGAALDAGCAAYEDAAVSCAEGLLGEGGASEAAEKLCSAGNYGDLPTYYRALGTIFCGTQLDAGAGGD